MARTSSSRSTSKSSSKKSTSRTASSGSTSRSTSPSRSSSTKRSSSGKGKGFLSSSHTRTTSGRRIFEPIDKTPTERREAGEKLPKSLRNTGERWNPTDVRELRTLSKKNTPTRIIGMKLGRDETSIRSKASKEGISLKPTNRSPYGPRRNSPAARHASLENLKKARSARNA
ncbi:MAG TPA: hypothetical protein VGM92_06250 [Candidatus Kapabacteria bacterium]|jgi:hypothetical protein